MEKKVTMLVHMDYNDGEHAYSLYQVDETDADAARRAIDGAWREYDGNGRAGYWDETLEAALKAAGIRFELLEYEPILIHP